MLKNCLTFFMDYRIIYPSKDGNLLWDIRKLFKHLNLFKCVLSQ